jgi:hypothetical protein
LFIWLCSFYGFVFFGYCVFHTFAPHWYINAQNENVASFHRMLEEGTTGCGTEEVAKSASVGVVIGGSLGVVAIGGAFLVIGLTPIGPIAGGLFAANMGAGLAAGSMISVILSAAMVGTTCAAAAGVGSVAGTAVGVSGCV